VLLMQEGEGRK